MVQHHPPGKIIPVDLSKFFWDPFSSNSAPLGFFAASGFKEDKLFILSTGNIPCKGESNVFDIFSCDRKWRGEVGQPLLLLLLQSTLLLMSSKTCSYASLQVALTTEVKHRSCVQPPYKYTVKCR